MQTNELSQVWRNTKKRCLKAVLFFLFFLLLEILILQGCAFQTKTKYGTLTVSITPGELFKLYQDYQFTKTARGFNCQIVTREGVKIVVE